MIFAIGIGQDMRKHMRIRVLSDLHVEGCHFNYTRHDEDVLVLAGDIGVGYRCTEFIRREFPMTLPIIFVPGNHEYYHNHFQQVNEDFKKSFDNTNVRFLYNETAVIDGVRFIGGTMHSNFGLFGEGQRWFVEQASKSGITDFHCIRTGATNRRWTIQDCKDEFDKFEKFAKHELNTPFDGKTVVVTHFCPSGLSVPERYKSSMITPFFTSDCEHLMGKSDLWLHGHTHDSLDYILHGTRVVCNPKGYGRENKDGFNPDLIIEV